MSGPDRGDLDREERIAGLLRRRAEGVHIPSFTVVEARLARHTSVPLVVLSATALVVVALIVGGIIAERRASVAEPQAIPPLSLSDRFGFVWASERSPARVNVEPETGQGGFELATQMYRYSACSCAVSPDGTRIAYWTGSTPGAVELRIVDVARPGLGTVIYKPPADRRWTALAWSSDGSGILFSLEAWHNPGDPVGNPSGTSLLVIEATGGTARTLATGDSTYVPLGWDRAAGIAAAGLSGEGGYMPGYITVRTNGDPAPQRTAMPEEIGMLSVQVSTDQRFVLGVFSTGQRSTLRWWRLADPGTMTTVPRSEQSAQATWRPQSSQIAWVENGRLQLLDVERGVTSTGGTLSPGPLAFRADGSAVAAPGYVLLDIASGRSVALPSNGYIVGSVLFTVAR